MLRNLHLSKSSLSAMESKVGMTSTSSLVSNSTLAKSSSSTPRRVSFDAIFLLIKRNLKNEGGSHIRKNGMVGCSEFTT